MTGTHLRPKWISDSDGADARKISNVGPITGPGSAHQQGIHPPQRPAFCRDGRLKLKASAVIMGHEVNYRSSSKNFW